jgi:hypothetical protein
VSKTFLNAPTPFLHFCDYLPFEKDLALNLYNLEFPLPNDDLYQVLLKLACWFWKRRFFQYKHMEIWFSELWPLLTPGDHGLYKLESTLYQEAFM